MAAKNIEFTMLYDGDCPLCVREVGWLKRRDKTDSLSLVDIAAEGFDASQYGRTQEELMARIHGVTAEGELVEGVEVFRGAYGAVGLGFLLVPTTWPLVRQLSDIAYRGFAKIRIPVGRLFGRCESGSCGL